MTIEDLRNLLTLYDIPEESRQTMSSPYMWAYDPNDEDNFIELSVHDNNLFIVIRDEMVFSKPLRRVDPEEIIPMIERFVERHEEERNR